MDELPSRTLRPQPPVVLLTVLTILSGLGIVAGVVAALMVLASEERAGQYSMPGILVALGCLLAGVVVGCVLWAIAHVVRRQSRLSLLQASAQRTLARHEEQRLEFLSPADSEADSDGELPVATVLAEETRPEGRAVLEEILAQLKELNENLLLSAEQREVKRKLRQEMLQRRFTREIERALEEGDLPRAERRLEEFSERVPGDAACERLRARLAEARDAAKARDIEVYTRQVSDLMAISSFEKAEETARELRARYPAEPEVAALMDRVLREGKMFRAERRERMYREVQRRAEGRQWRAALEAARNFVEAFPKSVDADAIRAMMPTIEDNARIEEVREIRDHIRDLIQRRRYAEAAEAAEDVIRRFPGTRAARELGRQLQRLRELARTPSGNGPPAR